MSGVQTISCQLRGCVHYHRSVGVPGFQTYVCTAFPNGIPQDIVLGKEQHLKSIKGDNGLQFLAFDDAPLYQYQLEARLEFPEPPELPEPPKPPVKDENPKTAQSQPGTGLSDLTDRLAASGKVPEEEQPEEKAYNPNQPRWEAGDRRGGRFRPVNGESQQPENDAPAETLDFPPGFPKGVRIKKHLDSIYTEDEYFQSDSKLVFDLLPPKYVDTADFERISGDWDTGEGNAKNYNLKLPNGKIVKLRVADLRHVEDPRWKPNMKWIGPEHMGRPARLPYEEAQAIVSPVIDYVKEQSRSFDLRQMKEDSKTALRFQTKIASSPVLRRLFNSGVGGKIETDPRELDWSVRQFYMHLQNGHGYDTFKGLADAVEGIYSTYGSKRLQGGYGFGNELTFPPSYKVPEQSTLSPEEAKIFGPKPVLESRRVTGFDPYDADVIDGYAKAGIAYSDLNPAQQKQVHAAYKACTEITAALWETQRSSENFITDMNNRLHRATIAANQNKGRMDFLMNMPGVSVSHNTNTLAPNTSTITQFDLTDFLPWREDHKDIAARLSNHGVSSDNVEVMMKALSKAAIEQTKFTMRSTQRKFTEMATMFSGATLRTDLIVKRGPGYWYYTNITGDPKNPKIVDVSSFSPVDLVEKLEQVTPWQYTMDGAVGPDGAGAGNIGRGLMLSLIPDNRAYCDGRAFLDNGEMKMSGGIALTPDFQTHVLAHEFGHYLEESNPNLRKEAVRILKSRTKGEQDERLGGVTGNPNYKDSEITRKDKFIHPYYGKQYVRGQVGPDGKPAWAYVATEIVSMAVDDFFTQPYRLLNEDPEIFNLAQRVLLGDPSLHGGDFKALNNDPDLLQEN